MIRQITLSEAQLLAWSRETLAEPQAPDAMVRLACQRLRRLSPDAAERARASDLLHLIESEAGAPARATAATRAARAAAPG
jgi:hypothetical protein